MSEQEVFSLAEHIGVIREVLDSGGQFTIFPRGTSMLPLIVQGRDSVSLVKAEAYSIGDIAFYQRSDGSFILHRIIGEKDGIFVMCGDNQLDPEYGIAPSQIIGKAEKITRKGRDIPVDKSAYRAYCSIWRSFFVRRVYFRVRRLFHGRK